MMPRKVKKLLRVNKRIERYKKVVKWTNKIIRQRRKCFNNTDRQEKTRKIIQGWIKSDKKYYKTLVESMTDDELSHYGEHVSQ